MTVMVKPHRARFPSPSAACEQKHWNRKNTKEKKNILFRRIHLIEHMVAALREIVAWEEARHHVLDTNLTPQIIRMVETRSSPNIVAKL